MRKLLHTVLRVQLTFKTIFVRRCRRYQLTKLARNGLSVVEMVKAISVYGMYQGEV